jgi:hypothetical protein
MATQRKNGKNDKGARQRRGARRAATAASVEIHIDALRAIIARAESGPLAAEDRAQLVAVVDTLAAITHELEQSRVTVERLRRLLFGPSSEKTEDVLGPGDADADAGGGGPTDAASDAGGSGARAGGCGTQADGAENKGKKGHGRNGAAAYTGARRLPVAHESLAPGDRCPACTKGKVYDLKQPAPLVRIRGMSPLEATVHECQRLRCGTCGEVFTAKAPPGVGEQKYDETAAAMIALLRYGCGLPFNRLERLGNNLGIPLPASTQWEVVGAAAEPFAPVWDELIRQAASGEVVHVDDTNMQVLSLATQIEKELAAGRTERTGIFTSGVVSTVASRQIAVFMTGRKHAGENLAKVLAKRAEGLPPPIQMCDALSRNTSRRARAGPVEDEAEGDDDKRFESVLANCLTHGRRHFVDVVGSFPEEVSHVLQTLREVYRHEATTRKEGMSPKDRLAYHREHSAPLMDGLKAWLDGLIAEKKVEPSSGLGEAIQYLDNHWTALTLFLRVPGAPLDNNVCERALKRAIVHRKNSLFFKTENGARVGDMFLSLIHTAELCRVNPFDYLVAVQRHRDAVAANPAKWMPWNYAEALAPSTETVAQS